MSRPPPPSATADLRREINPRIWRACAGASVKIPILQSRVYYFPPGHFEHCCDSTAKISSSSTSSSSAILCTVSSVELLADPITDEVFAHLSLTPIPHGESTPAPPLLNLSKYDIDEEENKVVAFAKILTPSDANNGGGFSVPRYCADSVLPPLDFQANIPVQNLTITDIHGVRWDFRHIYRGTPRRHLLTTGWSKFVNGKKLIAGDSAVFMKKSVNELFIGVRRAPVSTNNNETSFYGEAHDEFSSYNQSSDEANEEEEEANVKMGFRRSGKGKLTAKAVSEAMYKAANGMPFEVVYYPTARWSEFVVRAEEVESSMAIAWSPGTSVKMAMETDDSSRITWFQGTVSSTVQETGPWRGIPWKHLQITWDEPEVLLNMKRVNPWQVEVVANTAQFHAAFPPTKALKFTHSNVFFNGGEGESLYPRRGPPSAAPGVDPPRPYTFSYTTFPAGMQGARQYGFSSYNPTGGFNGVNPLDNLFDPLPKLEKFSTDMIFGSPSWDDLSPNNNTTNISSGNRVPNSSKANSFKLFGKIINVHEEHAESGLDESGLDEEENGSKESSDYEPLIQTGLSLNHGGLQGKSRQRRRLSGARA
ncbi:unnamed protein product [Cochlearia groenlandica]